MWGIHTSQWVLFAHLVQFAVHEAHAAPAPAAEPQYNRIPEHGGMNVGHNFLPNPECIRSIAPVDRHGRITIYTIPGIADLTTTWEPRTYTEVHRAGLPKTSTRRITKHVLGTHTDQETKTVTSTSSHFVRTRLSLASSFYYNLDDFIWPPDISSKTYEIHKYVKTIHGIRYPWNPDVAYAPRVTTTAEVAGKKKKKAKAASKGTSVAPHVDAGPGVTSLPGQVIHETVEHKETHNDIPTIVSHVVIQTAAPVAHHVVEAADESSEQDTTDGEEEETDGELVRRGLVQPNNIISTIDGKLGYKIGGLQAGILSGNSFIIARTTTVPPTSIIGKAPLVPGDIRKSTISTITNSYTVVLAPYTETTAADSEPTTTVYDDEVVVEVTRTADVVEIVTATGEAVDTGDVTSTPEASSETPDERAETVPETPAPETSAETPVEVVEATVAPATGVASIIIVAPTSDATPIVQLAKRAQSYSTSDSDSSDSSSGSSSDSVSSSSSGSDSTSDSTSSSSSDSDYSSSDSDYSDSDSSSDSDSDSEVPRKVNSKSEVPRKEVLRAVAPKVVKKVTKKPAVVKVSVSAPGKKKAKVAVTTPSKSSVIDAVEITMPGAEKGGDKSEVTKKADVDGVKVAMHGSEKGEEKKDSKESEKGEEKKDSKEPIGEKAGTVKSEAPAVVLPIVVPAEVVVPTPTELVIPTFEPAVETKAAGESWAAPVVNVPVAHVVPVEVPPPVLPVQYEPEVVNKAIGGGDPVGKLVPKIANVPWIDVDAKVASYKATAIKKVVRPTISAIKYPSGVKAVKPEETVTVKVAPRPQDVEAEEPECDPRPDIIPAPGVRMPEFDYPLPTKGLWYPPTSSRPPTPRATTPLLLTTTITIPGYNPPRTVRLSRTAKDADPHPLTLFAAANPTAPASNEPALTTITPGPSPTTLTLTYTPTVTRYSRRAPNYAKTVTSYYDETLSWTRTPIAKTRTRRPRLITTVDSHGQPLTTAVPVPTSVFSVGILADPTPEATIDTGYDDAYPHDYDDSLDYSLQTLTVSKQNPLPYGGGPRGIWPPVWPTTVTAFMMQTITICAFRPEDVCRVVYVDEQCRAEGPGTASHCPADAGWVML